MPYINMYNKLTNRVRALKSTLGLLPQMPRAMLLAFQEGGDDIRVGM